MNDIRQVPAVGDGVTVEDSGPTGQRWGVLRRAWPGTVARVTAKYVHVLYADNSRPQAFLHDGQGVTNPHRIWKPTARN